MRLFIGSFATFDTYDTLQLPDLHLSQTNEANLHLTYCFLGDVEDPVPVMQALKGLELHHAALPIMGVGCFHKRVLYAGVEDSRLFTNRQRICDALKQSAKAFHPHITLARLKAYDAAKVDAFLAQYRTHCFGTLQSDIHLIQSTLQPQGAQYKILMTL